MISLEVGVTYLTEHHRLGELMVCVTRTASLKPGDAVSFIVFGGEMDGECLTVRRDFILSAIEQL